MKNELKLLFLLFTIQDVTTGPYLTREEARQEAIDYIEMFYNSYRLHSSLGYMAPNDFEMNLALKKLTKK